jgi:hypothetical protein
VDEGRSSNAAASAVESQLAGMVGAFLGLLSFCVQYTFATAFRAAVLEFSDARAEAYFAFSPLGLAVLANKLDILQFFRR